MILRKLNLINFRNYKKETIVFSKNINIFIGNNAQGKTNVLESIYFLAVTKSYRTPQDSNLIRRGYDITKVKAELKVDNAFKSMAIELTPNSKKVRINEDIIKRISDFITNLNVILVAPEDIEIIKGSPAERRNFLNIELSQISKKYIKIQNEFNKLIKIRNDYLKMLYKNGNSDTRYLDSLTENLIEREVFIYQERKKFIDAINERIGKIFSNIESSASLTLKYETNVEFENYETEYLKDKLKEKYKKTLQKEMENGMTLYGPHRDDVKFMLDNEDIKHFGSQGQQKLAIIALRFAEIPIFELYTNTKPIVLLDDIFSELDKYRRNKVIKFIDEETQVIITTNDIKGISSKLVKKAKIFQVFNGKIMEKVE